MEVKKVDWDTIRLQWKYNLWPGRDEYKPMSSMVYNERDKYDMDIYEKYEPTFWAVYDGQFVAGVNSGFRTTDELYRSRGIYVSKAYRKQGIAQMLFNALEEQATEEGCSQIWSYPREGSHHAYLKFDFEITSLWHEDQFGNNVYVLKEIEFPEHIID